MPSSHGADPPYGNVHQQIDASQPNHPTTPHASIYVQQSLTNSPQHHKVRPAQSAELQLPCPIQPTPHSYLPPSQQQSYQSNFPPLPSSQPPLRPVHPLSMQTEESHVLEEHPDSDHIKPTHGWQLINVPKKRKREPGQPSHASPKQHCIQINNRFQTLNQQHEDNDTVPTQPPTPHPTKPPLYSYMEWWTTNKWSIIYPRP